jgi:hypothetical protein
MAREFHNAHMLIPADLWRALEERAVLEGSNVTALVIAACHQLLKAKRKKET